MGKVSKGIGCSVVGCTNNGYRSLDAGKVRRSTLDIQAGRRAYLCSEHYKQWKKEMKQSKEDDVSLRYG